MQPATPTHIARRAPAAGPGSMRRAALWLWLCALALRLQPALPVSVARGRTRRRREAGTRHSPMPCRRQHVEGEGSGDFFPRCLADPGMVSP